MGFDANGNWTSNFYPIQDRDNGVPILASKFQDLIQTDLKQSFDNCILRDGTGKPTSNINWNGLKITNLGTGTSSTDAVNKAQMDAAIASIPTLTFPVGVIHMAPLTSLEGFLLCNGQAVSRTTYADLFSAIGVNFGIGDGVTTFNVPDYRGCFLRGLGGDSETDMYTKQGSAVPNITGTFAGQRAVASSGALAAISTPYQGSAEHWVTREYDYSISLDASRSSSVYQNDVTEARPVNFAINFFIKY